MRRTTAAGDPAKLEDLPSPALIVDLDAFESNLAAAADLVRGSVTQLRPHVKTHRTLGLAIRQLASAGLPCRVVSSAGTSTFLQAVADPVITEIQAGTYAFMETDLQGLGLPFVPALTVSAMVISR